MLPGFCDTHIHVAALGFVMGYADPAVSHSPLIGWITATPVQDRSLAGLTARLPDGFDGEQRWADEAQLCHWVLKSGDDVLRTGAMGLTG